MALSPFRGDCCGAAGALPQENQPSGTVMPALCTACQEKWAASVCRLTLSGAGNSPASAARRPSSCRGVNFWRSTPRSSAPSRLERRAPCPFTQLEIPDVSPEQALTEDEARERTRLAVENMTEPDREIFLRHYYYFQSVAEIALALDMNVNTVKTRLRRGRARLKEYLREVGYEFAEG